MKAIRTLFLSMLALSLTACIYPYEADIPNSGKSLVIDGDILIGENTMVNVSFTQPMDGSGASAPPLADVWVEDDAGTVYDGVLAAGELASPAPLPTMTYMVDTKSAVPGRKYKLCVRLVDGDRRYESDWCEVQKPVSFDELKYIKDEEHNRLALAISISGQDSRYYRWSYEETWEYHAFYHAYYQYIPPASMVGGYGEITHFTDRDNYACWRSQPSQRIMLFSTEEQAEDRFEDLEFHLIPRTDSRLSVRYYINVHLQAMPKQGYEYWQKMHTDSDFDGSLFSPTPSGMAGNIHCVQDPDEMVIGYICAAQRVSKYVLYIDALNKFYTPTPKTYPELEIVHEADWLKKYTQEDMVPVSSTYEMMFLEYQWAPRWCADCRFYGGTNVPPSFWYDL